MVDLGGLGDLDLGQLQGYLQGLDFPASKADVAANAESNGAPQELVQQIKDSATERFNSPDEVLQTVQGGK